MGRIRKEYYCALQLAIDIVGGKWKLWIIWYLLESPKRFSDFMRRIPDISQKTLTQQLRELEADKLIIRTVYPVVPPKVEYQLSDFGRTIIPVLQAMCDWGGQYLQQDGICPTQSRQTQNGKDLP